MRLALLEQTQVLPRRLLTKAWPIAEAPSRCHQSILFLIEDDFRYRADPRYPDADRVPEAEHGTSSGVLHQCKSFILLIDYHNYTWSFQG